MRSHICSNWIMAINIPFYFFLSGWVSDQRSSCPHSLNHTTSCCTAPGPTLMSSFSFFEEKKKGGKKLNRNSLSVIHVHSSPSRIPAFLPHNETVIHLHCERVRPGTSAACEGDETKTGPWETRPRSALSVKKWFFKHATIKKKKRHIILFSLPTLHVCWC